MKTSMGKSLEFLYDENPMPVDEKQPGFVFFEKRAATVAVKAMRAKTWGRFARVVGVGFAELLRDWGDEIAEVYGRVPRRSDPLNLSQYWGACYFSELAADPRQVAYHMVCRRPRLTAILEALGFEFQIGPPTGNDYITFPSDELVAELLAELRKAGMAGSLRITRVRGFLKDVYPTGGYGWVAS